MNKQSISLESSRTHKRRELLFGLLFALMLLMMSCFMLIYGDRVYSLGTVLKVLGGAEIKGASYAILKVRLPRTIVGILSGIAFGIAGNTFQTILRNSLASPDILGVTSGASAVAVFAMMILGLEGAIVSGLAIAGGIITALIILLLSRRSGFSIHKVILMGIGMQAIMQALISYVLQQSSAYDIANALQWLSGSLNGSRMEDVPLFSMVVLVLGAIILLLSREMQVLRLGEELSVTLGVRTDLIRMLLLLCAVAMAATSCAVTGPLASVAFMSGPIAVRLIRTGGVTTVHAGLIGAIIVLFSEAIGQYAFATRYPVGVVTGILGAPFLLYLLIRSGKAQSA